MRQLFFVGWIIACSLNTNAQFSEKVDAEIDLIKFYQKFISGIRGGECPMYPSCSVYGVQSLKIKGALSGILSIPDRLLRCGHDQSFYDVIYTNDWKLLDFPTDSLNKANAFTKIKKNYPFNDTLPDTSVEEKLINDLMLHEYYSEALIEIKRYKIKYDTLSRELTVNYLKCLKALGKEEDAIFKYQNSFNKNLQLDLDIIYEMASIYKKIGDYEMELEMLQKLKNFERNGRIDLLIGDTYVRMGDFEKANDIWMRINKDPYLLKIAIRNIELYNNYKNVKDKKEYKAAFLNIIPGAGYLYAGHKSTALSAFILNSLLIFAAYTSLENENYGMAALTGTFSLSFYLSGIVGAKESAKRFNKKKKQDFIRKLHFDY